MENFDKPIIFSEKTEPFLEGEMETNEKIWEKLNELVRKNYEGHNVDEELIRQFMIHNRQVEDFVKRFSEEEEFNDKEKEIAVLSAILHDVAKGYGNFLEHGEEGGRLAKEILINIGVSEDLAESVRLGIERHMGREGYPAKLAKEKYGESFEYPMPKTKVGEMLYKCDILTQLTKEGFDKILLLRETDPENLKEDEGVAAEKNISVKGARLLSVLESAKKSYELIMRDSDNPLESVKEYATELWEGLRKEYPIYSDFQS